MLFSLIRFLRGNNRKRIIFFSLSIFLAGGQPASPFTYYVTLYSLLIMLDKIQAQIAQIAPKSRHPPQIQIIIMMNVPIFLPHLFHFVFSESSTLVNPAP
jgi:hypothetical protein